MRIEFENAGKRFGRVVALDEVSLALPAGSRTALIGPNGSGKSTLVRLLMGMLHGQGRITIDGLDVRADRQALAARIAYMPQVSPRLAAPVRDVVGAIASLRGISTSRVSDVATRLQIDLAHLARRPFRALSGGQRQKVLAALTLSSGAELYLLDEPTASLDPQSRGAFFDLIEDLGSEVTIVLSSHRLEEIRRLVDRVLALHEGRVAWNGSADDYLREHAVAVIELRARSEAADWLAAEGFAKRTGGWWTKSIRAGERAGVIAELVRHLNGQLVDVTARDVERLHLKQELDT